MALVMTIIVMLILVGVTVTVAVNGGLFEQTKKAAKWLDELKLRLDYGKTGQQEGIDNYLWYTQYKVGGPYGNYPMVGTDGKFTSAKYYNKELKWETTTTYNVGLDWGLFNQRFSGSFDWYYRKTKDLINSAPVAGLYGFADKGLQNIGSLKNVGVELSLNWKPIQTKDWFPKAKLCGLVAGEEIGDPKDAVNHPDVMEKAYRLGKDV